MNAVVRLHSIKTPPPLLPSTPHSFIRSFFRSFPSFCSCPHTRLSGVGVSRPNPGFAYRKNKRREAEAFYLEEEKKEKMTVTPAVRISERKLVVNGRTVLTGVPDNVVSTSPLKLGPVEGVFLGAAFDESKSRHVVSLGTLRDVRFLSCFRFKLWWMAQKMGTSGRDVPLETQFLLVETKEVGYDDLDLGNGNGNVTGNVGGDSSSTLYTVFLPLVEGPFRACLQGNSDDEIELCIESGDDDTKQSFFSHCLFVSTGSDPFAAITDAIAAVKSHIKTFRQRSEKKLPGIVDYFGWCTWDAFYQDVTQEGVEAGLASLAAGGVPPKFVIIDDGWQSVGSDEERREGDDGQKPLLRLTGIKENEKFQKEEGRSSAGIENIVKVAKEKHGLKYVYVWHAITGYWGGVRPGVAAMEHYSSMMQYPMVSPGVTDNEPGWKTDAMALQGLGLVNPKQVYRFYNELHSYLANAGIDGVKVDVQCILETLGAGLGGRVQLTRQYHQALDASVAKNFTDNGIIACMSHNTDALYCSKQTAVVRASDDFYPRDPVSHTIHIASVAYNSVFLGEFMQPDWDMFHSQHPAGEYHASARAISGGPIYVSDAPGHHNFQVLRKLVLPDGSILRPRLPGRPTRDCLFSDPARDGKSLLKIWNMNRFTGVLGMYNCQGAAWNNVEKKNTFHQTKTDALTGVVRASDVHHLREAVVGDDWEGDCVAYRHGDGDGELIRLPAGAAWPVSLKILQHEIFTVSPVKVLAPGVEFAPVGLIDMYNAGGAIVGLSYRAVDGVNSSYFDSCSADEVTMRPLENRGDHAVATITMEVKGCGRLGVYSSIKPRKCLVGSEAVEFEYDSSSGLATVALESMPESGKQAHVMLLEL